MTSSNGNIFLVTGPLCGEFTGHRWIPLTKASDAERWCFLWSVLWINGWVHNHEAGDLRRYRAHYDVIVITSVAMLTVNYSSTYSLNLLVDNHHDYVMVIVFMIIDTVNRYKHDRWSNAVSCVSPLQNRFSTLRWHHNVCDSVSNHQPYDCLFNRLFRRRSKKTSKLRVTSLCAGNSPVTGEFPAQMASNAENISIWWRHHIKMHNCLYPLWICRCADIASQNMSLTFWCLNRMTLSSKIVHFIEWKSCKFKIWFQRNIFFAVWLTKNNIVSGNSLVPTRRHAITQANVD